MSANVDMAGALHVIATNLNQPCPCCEIVAGEQHHEDCTFEGDAPALYMRLAHDHALAVVAMNAIPKAYR